MAVLNLNTLVATIQSPRIADGHGAGMIGTSSFGAPKTYRRTDNGIIITQYLMDITGLQSPTTDGDVIGLAAGAAYFGQNVVADNGIIFKTEFACFETPTTGINNIDVAVLASGELAMDGEGGTDLMANAGVLIIGQSVVNLIPTIPADYYFYLIAGAGGTADTYASGQYMFTTWGHALLA